MSAVVQQTTYETDLDRLSTRDHHEEEGHDLKKEWRISGKTTWLCPFTGRSTYIGPPVTQHGLEGLAVTKRGISALSRSDAVGLKSSGTQPFFAFRQPGSSSGEIGQYEIGPSGRNDRRRSLDLKLLPLS